MKENKQKMQYTNLVLDTRISVRPCTSSSVHDAKILKRGARLKDSLFIFAKNQSKISFSQNSYIFCGIAFFSSLNLTKVTTIFVFKVGKVTTEMA